MNKKSKLAALCFVAYALVMLFILLIPNNYRGHNVLVGGLTWERWSAYVAGGFNLVPLREIARQIGSIAGGQAVARNLIYLLGNFIGFAPLGLFLPGLFKKQKKFLVYSSTVILILIGVELSQLITMRGSFDIDDIILNLTGACIGFWLLRNVTDFISQSDKQQCELKIRSFEDNDLPLMQKWLATPHVATWYEQPDQWLHEIENRHSEFAFLTHLIAEVDAVSIGFCQYYDCYYTRHLEDWGQELPVPGEVFSIDYLIGEPEYLRQGYAKKMIQQMLGMIQKVGAKQVIVDPDENNTASNRLLESCGFAHNGNCYILDIEVANEPDSIYRRRT